MLGVFDVSPCTNNLAAVESTNTGSPLNTPPAEHTKDVPLSLAVAVKVSEVIIGLLSIVASSTPLQERLILASCVAQWNCTIEPSVTLVDIGVLEKIAMGRKNFSGYNSSANTILSALFLPNLVKMLPASCSSK